MIVMFFTEGGCIRSAVGGSKVMNEAATTAQPKQIGGLMTGGHTHAPPVGVIKLFSAAFSRYQKIQREADLQLPPPTNCFT
jgi:hypothetical protein